MVVGTQECRPSAVYITKTKVEEIVRARHFHNKDSRRGTRSAHSSLTNAATDMVNMADIEDHNARDKATDAKNSRLTKSITALLPTYSSLAISTQMLE